MEANPRRIGAKAVRDEDTRTVRVRPFRELIQRGEGRPVLVVVGRLHEGAFVLSALGRDLALVTLPVGGDERGDFADIAIGEWSHGEIRVRVEPEYEEPTPGLPDMPPGGEVALYWAEDLRAWAELELARQGKDPRHHTVLAPAAENFVVAYFDFDGLPNGTSYTDSRGQPSGLHRTRAYCRAAEA